MNYITQFLTLQNQLRIWHWQSESHVQHVALGNAYDNLNELIDAFIEEFSGKYSKIISKAEFKITLYNLSATNINEFLDKYIVYLSSELPTYLREDDTNLLNIRDEMLSVIRKLKYILTLK